jgi:hypothetical protein
MVKKSSGKSVERGSPSRSTSETSTGTCKSSRARSGEAAAGQETRAPKTVKDSLAPSDGERAGVRGRPSSLLDTRVVYCGDNLEQLAKLPDACVDLIYIDPPFNSNRNYEVFWRENKEKRAFADRHESTRAYVDYGVKTPWQQFSSLINYRLNPKNRGVKTNKSKQK